jgi:formylglycine-generating enzyme required for sulfatase activity
MIQLLKRKQQTEQKLLVDLGFVNLSLGQITIGTDQPLPCRFEGERRNETPARRRWVKPFWIAKRCVTNEEYEKYKPKHYRSRSSDGRRDPVTDVTYFEALCYANWLSRIYNLPFDLPTEDEWTLAAAPDGWEYPYQHDSRPDQNKAHTMAHSQQRKSDYRYHALSVDLLEFKPNVYGLYQMGGNVGEMTKGCYYTLGHTGANTDGAYFIAKGGAFCLCPYSARVSGRMLFDVACRHGALGFRLVCRWQKDQLGGENENSSLSDAQPIL